jgi:fungal STAND N-terminal Goodbye domain
MSSSTTSANFRSILESTLDGYAKQTGIDLTTHPCARELRNCDTSEDVLRLLQDKETAFEAYRDKNRKLINYLRPIVQVVHAFSGALGEVGGVPWGFAPPHLISLCSPH